MSQFSVNAECPTFLRDVKRAKKKHPSIAKELIAIIEKMRDDPTAVGFPIANYGRALWGKRIGIPGQTGKSGGYRLLYFVDFEKRIVAPVGLYFKGEEEMLSRREIEALMKQLAEHLNASQSTPQPPAN